MYGVSGLAFFPTKPQCRNKGQEATSAGKDSPVLAMDQQTHSRESQQGLLPTGNRQWQSTAGGQRGMD